MSKKIIVGALSVAAVLGAFAVLQGSTFAATTGWHQVTVTPGQDLILGGSVSSTIELTPTIEAIDTEAASALSVKSTEAWKIQWQAVQGNSVANSTVAATGTNLGVAGFTNTSGYTYNGGQATAGTDTWGVALSAAGGTLSGTPTLTTNLSTVATGTATSSATLTPTYSAGTSGSLGTDAYYGTIYYVLSSNV